MKALAAFFALLLCASVGQAGSPFVGFGTGGVVVVNNNNNNNARAAMVQVAAQPTRAFRPFLRRLAPRVALNRDARFGAPVDRFGRVRGAAGVSVR